ncbi:MAG: radical SAM protein [Candidatus Brocadiales bacterium]|nr:radical SAM protein [Candidatus Brocadiales bacterium]
MKRFHVILIKPSKYDEDGYVISWFRGVLVSNSMAMMNALTEHAERTKVLGQDVEIITHYYDETVRRIPVKRLAREVRLDDDRGVVCMVGVQTNQFSRAVDLGKEFIACGLNVMIGGFHVSGSIQMLPDVPEEIKDGIDVGITMVAGEVENRWGELLIDAYNNSLKPLYNFLNDQPSLEGAVAPFVSKENLSFNGDSRQTSFDAGRGCPFKCSFCTIINVQGNAMRGRTPDDIEALIKRNQAQDMRGFFITDDNFARHPRWEEIIDRIISLKKKKRVTLMIQTDTMSYKIPRFVDKLAEAGCRRIFIGMESVNPDNLKACGKPQNRIHEYRTMLQAWRDAGVVTHAGYIIGFPGDTYDSIMRDVERLKREIPIEFVVFFMMTPLPGSQDHLDNYLKGVPMAKEMNDYDTTLPCAEHPRMSRDELMRAYRDAWKSFYSSEHVETILKRRKDRRQKNITRDIIWFRSAAFVEGLHPFLFGIFRIKGRKRRSPKFPVESIPVYYCRRIWDITLWTVRMSLIFIEMRYLSFKVNLKKNNDYMDITISSELSVEKTVLSK